MNRNATGMVGGAMLFSILASPPRSPAVAGGTAAPAGVERAGTRVEADSDSKLPTVQGGDWKPDVFKGHGRREAVRKMAELFLSVCREDNDDFPEGEEPGPAIPLREEIRQLQDKIRQRCDPSPKDFVIALVPDPVHTRLALVFDRRVEAIQEAAQDNGDQFVKAYLPWDARAHPESPDPAAWLAAEAYAKGREEFPGVLAFRDPTPRMDGRQRHLFVLLVAESPTGGVDKRQFLNAIDWIQFTAATSQESLHPRILGPTFSGSLASLSQMLRCPKRACYGNSHIFSGSISDRSAVLAFLSKRELSATFASFLEADDVVIERFMEYLSAHGQSRSLAILSEDETAYGTAGLVRPNNTDKTIGPTGPVREPGCPATTRASDLEAGTGCLYLYFPREISRLRAAYQSSGVGSARAGAQSAPRDTLPLNLEISGADDDTIASFSKQSPLSQEGVLLGIVSELRLNAIRYVVLRATDPLDLLFLSRYLAAAYPKARIVTVGADMLFRREVEDKQLHGTLALSTYSLADHANRGFADANEHPQRVFPSSTEAGTYNALRSLLATPAEEGAPPNPLDRYRLESESLHLYQYGWFEHWRLGRDDPDAFTPPVHLLALGRDQYWPIAHLGPIKPSSGLGKPPIPTLLPTVSATQFGIAWTEPLHYHAPISWVVADVLVLLLALAFAGALWFSSGLSSSPTMVQFAATGNDARQSMVVAATGVLTAMFLILLFPFVAGNGTWQIEHGRGLEMTLYVVLGVLLLVSLIDTLDHRRPARPRGRLPWLILVVLLAIAGWSALRWVVDDTDTGAWRHAMLRSMQLTSGVSPVLPMLLLLAAAMWWMLQVSVGYLLLDARRPRLPMEVHRKRVGFIAETVAQDRSGCRTGISDVEHAAEEDTYMVDDLWRVLRPERLLSPQYVVPFATCLALPVVLRVDSLMTLENRLFGLGLWYLFLLPALALICGTTVRLWKIWLQTRRLLTMLDSLPLRRGFQELEGFSWQPLWRLGFASSTVAQRISARVREARDRAQSTLPDVFGNCPVTARDVEREAVIQDLERIQCLRRPFSADWRQRRELERSLLERYGSVQEGNARAAGHALDYLAEHWKEEGEAPRRCRRREDHDELSVRACECFACLLYVSFLVVVLERMRTMMVAIGGMYVLVLLALTTYPFQPRATIVTVLAILLFFIIAVVTTVFAQVHRNATLSHITNTNPGELGSDFWLKTGSFVALPLFTFLASQFPELNRFLYSWVEPALRALNK